MAAFSSFQQIHPFLLDSLLLPSPDNNSTTFQLNPLSCNNNNTNSSVLHQPAFLNNTTVSQLLSQENDSSSAPKQSTATESSSAAAAVSRRRRRKTRNGSVNHEEEKQGGKRKKQKRDEEKTSDEPPKDYIHVRARRGQATDSHSLAERVRREKISERMRILQKLVPGCDKVTGKALMLDEIINYVQSLQNQVEFLSMKLASMSPVVYDFGVDLDTFMLRPQMGPTEGATTTAPLFPPLLDNSLLHSHLPISQGNINEEDQRGLRNNNNSFCW